MFFVNKILVQPNRFRPESSGGAGSSGHGEKAFLHLHAQLLVKILQQNHSLTEAILKSEDEKQKPL